METNKREYLESKSGNTLFSVEKTRPSAWTVNYSIGFVPDCAMTSEKLAAFEVDLMDICNKHFKDL
jgi:hypothetical protein